MSHIGPGFLAFASIIVACQASPISNGELKPEPAQCLPTDQDAYVYFPDRLKVLSPCIRVSGVVKELGENPTDGDQGIELLVDPPFERHITFATRAQYGPMIHVEIICYRNSPEMYPEPKAVCARNPSPLRVPLPKIGDHVWMEGRWVLDLEHGAYAELHPLYRWSPLQTK